MQCITDEGTKSHPTQELQSQKREEDLLLLELKKITEELLEKRVIQEEEVWEEFEEYRRSWYSAERKTGIIVELISKRNLNSKIKIKNLDNDFEKLETWIK